MRFQVPQFIDIEDKIFGPLTIKQFLYLGGGAGMTFALWVMLPNFIATPFIIIVLGLSLALAFYEKDNQPFINILESGFKFMINSKLYVWKKTPKINKKRGVAKETNITDDIQVPRLSDSKLSDLSWSLDIKDKLVDDMNNN